MPESRRAGRLSGGKGPPLASTKRGALPPGPPILSQTRFITGNGQPYGYPFPVFRRDNDVIRWRAVCWRAVCGPLDAKESGRDWLRAKKDFSEAAGADGGSLSPVRSCLPLGGQGGCPARHPKTGTRHTDQKKSFFGVGKSARGGGAVFTKKRPSPSRISISFPGSDGAGFNRHAGRRARKNVPAAR